MKIEQLTLRSLGDGMLAQATQGARVFIPSGRPPEPDAPPPPPVFSEADLKSAERDGFQKGFLEGIKDGLQQADNNQANINKQIAAMTGNFEQSIQPLLEHYCKFSATIHAEMPKVALAIARKVAGPALQENAHLLIADIASRACETLMNEAKLTISAHESLGNTLEKMLQDLASRLPEHTEIIILRDPDMPVTNCRIDWKLGSMQHSVQDVWVKVEKAIENLSAVSTRDGTADLNQLQQQILSGDTEPEPTEIPPTLENHDKNETKE